MMIAGVTSFSPSQLTPPNGFAKVVGADCDLVLPVLDGGELEGAVRLRLGGLDRLPSGIAKLDGDSGQPELFGLDFSGSAAAGLEVPPDDPGDAALERLRLDRLLGVLRHLVRRDGRQAEQGYLPWFERLLQRETA